MIVEPGAAVAEALGQSYPAPPGGSRKRAIDEANDDIADIKIKRGSDDRESQGSHAPPDYTNPPVDIFETPDKQNPVVTMSEDNMYTTLASAADEASQTGSAMAAVSTASPTMSALPSNSLSIIAEAPTTTTNKKRKLSTTSKEVKILEKEEKERLKLEERTKREEEKRTKEEEKKKREMEREEEKKRREEKKRIREEERVAKDEEKRKKEEEKMKKEKVSGQAYGFVRSSVLTNNICSLK
jgi:chromatin assembly factor 1 subunit A